MKTVFIVTFFVCMMLITSIAWSEIVYVNGATGDDATGERGNPDKPFKTIQKGIDVAITGDTVLVADGRYTGTGNKNLDFKGKAITVTSENGAENCIIDCEKDGRGFYFHSGETLSSVVSGFTIMNGKNRDSRGAGIYCYYSSPTITHNTITDNYADNGYGGGIACNNSFPSITHNTITNNYAGNNGGGIDCYYSSATITNNVIIHNSVQHGGGINFDHYSSPNGESQIAYNTIIKNTASSWGYGGGISCVYYSNPQIINNIIADNEASYSTGFGGGIYCQELYFSLEIRYNAIICNKAKQGGGIYCINNASPIIINNTISNNSTNDSGGGIYCSGPKDVSPTVRNSIFWNNTPQEIKLYKATITVTYSDIKGGWVDESNINVDPLFVNPECLDGDYHLQAGSPCIDAGDPSSPKDPDGTRADMGAYYFDQSPLIGDVSGNGSVTTYDASLVLQSIVELINLSERQKIAADVTGNGTVTALDAALILQYTVGLITQFPVQKRWL